MDKHIVKRAFVLSPKHMSHAVRWYDDRTEEKMIATRNLNRASSANRTDVLR